MAVTGSSTDANGDQLLVSLKTPYENVVEVLRLYRFYHR